MAISAVIERVHSALMQLGTDCAMEEVAGLCPELTWNQVFLAVDYLSRTGRIRITTDAGRTYRVKAYRAGNTRAQHASTVP
ncbi:MAG: hypothetical protein OEY86_14710 [Nitrospira sp.]|nr:hypothetical protein [Nitrospira sp.]